MVQKKKSDEQDVLVVRDEKTGEMGRTVLAKSILPIYCTIKASVQASLSWRWTAAHSPKSLHHRRSSDTSKERSLVLKTQRKAISTRRKVAHCFWTKWVISHQKLNRCYSVPYRNGGSVPLATSPTAVSTSASSPPPTRIWKRRSMKSVSGRICYTAYMTLK